MPTDETVSASISGRSASALLPPGARYVPDVIGRDLRAQAWSELLASPDTFGPSQVHVDGQWRDAPRLVASFADTSVRMSGMLPSRSWLGSVDRIRALVTSVCGQEFNYGLANLYRDGEDFAGWHADKAAMHHPGSVIAIVSLGAVRTIEFRGLPDSGATAVKPVALDLAPGSVLVMDLPLQERCEHRIPAVAGPAQPRISITLRSIPMDDASW